MTPKKSPPYRRIPGRGAGLVLRHYLWLGADHLLTVETAGYTERYRRYFLRDIQAIVWCRTPRWKRRLFIFGPLTLLFFLLATYAAGSGNGVAAWGWGFATVLPGIILAHTLIFGPTCTCVLRNASGTHPLPAVRHVRYAERMLALVKPEIERAQGRVTRETITQGSTAGQVAFAPVRKAAIHAASTYGGSLHRIVFALLIPDALLSLALFIPDAWRIWLAGSLLGMVVFVLLIAAAVKQSNAPVPEAAKWSIWGTLANYFISGMVTYWILFGAMMKVVTAKPDPSAILSKLQAAASGDFRLLCAVHAILLVAAAGTGLIAMKQYRAPRVPEPPR